MLRSGKTVLMVEPNLRTALNYSNRAPVVEMGGLELDRPRTIPARSQRGVNAIIGTRNGARH